VLFEQKRAEGGKEFKDKSGGFMYLPTRSASCQILALTLVWTEKPDWRHTAIFSRSLRDELLAKEPSEDLALEELGQDAFSK